MLVLNWLNWYSFLGHEYNFFNAIAHRLTAVKALGSQKVCGFFLKPHEDSAIDLKLQLQSLRNCSSFNLIFFHKTNIR